jgi:CHAT domain-containing protein
VTDYLATAERAERHFARGEYQAALDEYQAALTARLGEVGSGTGGFSSLDAVVVERLADLSVTFGRFDAAANLLSALRILFDRAGNRYAADHAGVRLALVHLAQHRYSEAGSVLLSLNCQPGPVQDIEPTPAGLRAWEKRVQWPQTSAGERAILLTRLLLAMGRIASGYGEYQAAIAFLRRGLEHCAASAGDRLLAATRPILLVFLGTAYLEHGSFVLADQVTAEVRRIGHDRTIEVGLLEAEARSFLLQGNLGLAHRKLEEAVAQCGKLGALHATAIASLNLAQLLISLNQVAAALGLIDQVEAAVSAGPLQSRAQFLRRLAGARARSLAEGIAIAPTLLEVWSRAPTAQPAAGPITPPVDDGSSDYGFLDLFETRALTFHWLLGEGRLTGARSYQRELENIFGHSDSVLIRGRLDHLAGLLAYYEGDLVTASRLLESADQAAESTGGHFDRWQVLRALAWTRDRAGASSAAADIRARSDSILEQLLGSLDPIERAAFQLNKWTVEEEHLWSACEQTLGAQEAARVAGPMTRFRREWRLLRVTTALLDRIDAHRRVVARRTHQQDDRPELEARSSWLSNVFRSRRRPILRLVALPDRVLIVLIRGWTVRIAISRIGRLALRELVADFHRGLRSGYQRQHADTRLAELAEVLQLDGLLRILPADVEELSILPDDVLHGVPFAALPIQGGTLTNRVSVTVANEWRRRRAARSGNGRGFLVALAHGDHEYPSLPGVSVESGVVNDAWAAAGLSVDRLEERMVSVAALQRGIQEAEYVHIACHGVFQPDDPAASGLVVISPRGREGILSIRDLACLDLIEVRLAVLSSCWAADNFVLPGRQVISLPETLVRAGVGCVVACLWAVSDEVTPSLLRSFYKSLASLPPARALRQAQLEIRGSLLKFDTTDPVFWAGFQVYSDG